MTYPAPLNAIDKEILRRMKFFWTLLCSGLSDELTEDFKAYYSNIPWRAIKGLRNRIVHEYGNVDPSVIYDTIKNDIPELLEELEAITV